MRNAHINLNEFTNASRVLKQVKSLVAKSAFNEIMIIALGRESLRDHEVIMPGVNLYRIQLFTRDLPKSLIFQSLKYIEFYIRAFWMLVKFKPHVVNSHAIGAVPIASLYKFLFKARLVYDAHELETEQVGGKNLRKYLSKLVEKILIKQHDLMFVVSESIADWYANTYRINRPTVVLNAPNKRALIRNNYFRDIFGIRDNQIILIYQGGLVNGRGVQLIIDAFKKRIDDRVVAVFMGYGPLKDEIIEIEKQKSNIFFYPSVEPHLVLEYTSSADIGIHLIQNTCLNHDYCMPNKLFEYAMAGLPVLVSNMKDMSELVKNNQMGAVISDFSADGINQAIDDFLIQDLATMKANAYRVACKNSWEIQEQKMLSAYEHMLRKKG